MKFRKIYRAVRLIIQLFIHTWKPWIHSKYFKQSGFYAIAAAASAFLTMFIFIFLIHEYILAVIMFCLGCFDLIINWYLWLRKVFQDQYEKENDGK